MKVVDGVAVPAATMSAHVDTVVAGTNTSQSLAEVCEEAVGGAAVPELHFTAPQANFPCCSVGSETFPGMARLWLSRHHLAKSAWQCCAAALWSCVWRCCMMFASRQCFINAFWRYWALTASSVDVMCDG